MQNQKRVVIDYVSPSVNNGEFYIKRVINEIVNIDAHILADGHDVLGASILYKHEKDKSWKESRLRLISNDEWKGVFSVKKQGYYTYKVQAWVDYALNWRYGLIRKINDGQHVNSELLEGAEHIEAILDKVNADDKAYLEKLHRLFKNENDYGEAITEATTERLYNIFYANPVKFLSNESKEYKVYVDRKKARFSTWYEFFPRSASEKEGVHGLRLAYQGKKPYLSKEERLELVNWIKTHQTITIEVLRDYIESQYGVVYDSKQSYYELLSEGEMSYHRTTGINPKYDETKVLDKREEIKKKWHNINRN